jgi:RNA polymerase sigma-70 factor (ECF subfamily)
VGQTQGPAAGLAALDALAGEVISGFQPAWAVRAHLLARAGRIAESLQAYTQAAHLALDPAVRAHLLGAMEALRAKC